MIRIRLSRSPSALASLHVSPVVCCFTGLLLFAAPVAFVAPVRATETNNTLPTEEETKPTSQVGEAQNHARQRARNVSATFLPVVGSNCIVTSRHVRTRAPNGLSEHSHREGLGTPLRC